MKRCLQLDDRPRPYRDENARHATPTYRAAVVLAGSLVATTVILVAAGRVPRICLADTPDTQPAWMAARGTLSADQRFLAGLRGRRLFRLAEAYCLDRLPERELAPRERAELAIELARTYAAQAMQSAADARPALWHRAHQVGVDFQNEFAASPYLVLVQLQDALVWLDQGELACAEAEVASGRERLLSEARDWLRAALRKLDAIEAELAVARRRRSGGPSAAEPSLLPAELEALGKHIAYQIARALRHQAQSYAVASADRTNSLRHALERLAPLAELPVADRLVWRSRIDQISCHRLLGETDRAVETLANLFAASPPPDIAGRAQAEKIRLLLATDQVGEALAASAVTAGQQPVPAGAELDLARLEAMIVAWRAAARQNDPARAARLGRQAAAQVRQIEQQHGAYWMRRGESLLADTLTDVDAQSDVMVLKRAAQSFYRSGKPAQAVAMYARAAAQARVRGDAEQAFDTAFTAATIEHDLARRSRGQDERAALHRAAMDRFGDLARTLPHHPRAAEAHLLAIYSAAEIVRHDSTDKRRQALARYVTLANEHLQRWPLAATSDQVRWWIGALREAQQRWEEAILAYREIRPQHIQHAPAVRATMRCYDRWLAELATAGSDIQSEANAAATHFRRLMTSPDGRLPERWDPAARAAAMGLAKILLKYTQDGHVQAEQALTAALAGQPPPRSEWEAQARSLLVLALAGQRRVAAADAVLARVPRAAPVADLVPPLMRLVASAGPKDRRELAALAVTAADRALVGSAGLEAEGVQRVETARAAALAATGQRQAALDAYLTLAKKYPNDGRILAAQATLLATAKDARSLDAALSTWRQVQRISRPGGERWLRARYGQAAVHAQRGEMAKAAKLIKITRVLHPELGGVDMQQKFLELLAHCQANQK